MSKAKKKLVDFSQSSVTVTLKKPFMWGSQQVRSITMRTCALVKDLEEMDAEPENEKTARYVRFIAALTDVDQNGKGIPHKTLGDNLSTRDYLNLVLYAGEIMMPDDEEEADPKEKSSQEKVTTLRATGGTSQQQ